MVAVAANGTCVCVGCIINYKFYRMEEQKLRQLFKNRSNCYVDTDDVVQGMDEDCFIETVNEALRLHDVSGRSEQLPQDAFEIIDNGMENEMKLRQMIDQWCEGQLGNTDEALEKADLMFTAARDIFYGFGGGNCH